MVTECVHRMRAALVGAALTIHGAAVAGERAPLPAVTAWVMGTGLDLVRTPALATDPLASTRLIFGTVRSEACAYFVNTFARADAETVQRQFGDAENGNAVRYGNLIHPDICGGLLFPAGLKDSCTSKIRETFLDHAAELKDYGVALGRAVMDGNPPGDVAPLTKTAGAFQAQVQAIAASHPGADCGVPRAFPPNISALRDTGEPSDLFAKFDSWLGLETHQK